LTNRQTPRGTWVDELQRADDITNPWSVHAIQILPDISNDELRQMQEDGPVLGVIIQQIAQGEAPTVDRVRAMPLEARKLWSQRPTVFLHDGLLVRRDGDHLQLVVPYVLRERLFQHVHGGPLAATWGQSEQWHN